MDRALAEQDEEEKEFKRVPDLKLITGGKEPPTTSSGNWLKDLEVGTVFFVHNKLDRADFNLLLFRLEGKDGPNNKLICIRSPVMPKEIYVDPHRFCNRYDLYHTYGVMLLPKEEIIDERDREPPQSGQENPDVERPS